MESLSRPPHRRKHSKNPYDDVSLSNGVERESLDAHEYAEIFSGSSSIPVLDLSGLDERVGSGDFRSSKLDYTNIFGGFRNDDVAVPYEELFNGSAKKTKPRNPKKAHSPPQESDSSHSSEKPKMPSDESSDQSADGAKKQFNLSFNKINQQNTDPSNGNPKKAHSPPQESYSSHSSEKPKMPSDEASDQSADGANKQFNLSFNKTNQRNTDPSNGKTHIAQLHAVPGFTYFVDGASRPQAATGNDKPINSLKRDVSRTWSFSAEVKDGLNHQKSHTTPDKSQSRPPPNFTPKKEAPEKIIGEGSPPYYGEDFDENSVAAASAAALKKAIDQAQESIRLAKMIMDRKKEGYQNKYRQRGSKKEKSKAKYEELDPTFTVFDGVDGKFTPSLKENEVFINAAKIEVTRVWENIEAAKEHGTVISGGAEFFSLTGSRSESVCNDKKIESEKIAENVVSEETRSEGAGFPVLSDNVDKTENLENLKQREKIVCHAKGTEVESELVGRVLDTSQSIQELKKNVEKAENKVEKVINTPQRARKQWNVLAEAGKNLGVGCQVDVGTEERENVVDGKGKQELEEMLNVEHFTELRSGFDNFMNASCNVGEIETLGQVETERESEIVPERKENGFIWKTHDDETNLWFESEEQLKKAFPEIKMGEKRVDETHEPEIDNQKQNHPHDVDEPKLREELEQNKVEAVPEIIEVGANNCAHEPEIDNQKQNHPHDVDEPKLRQELEQNKVEAVPEIIEVGANNRAEIQKSTVFYDSEETNDILGGSGKIEENPDKCQYEEHIDEAVDVNIDVNSSCASTITSETREACNIDLDNKPDECERVVEKDKENDNVPEVIETFSAIDKDREDDTEMSGIETLRRIASEEIFVESKLHNIFDSLSFDENKMENVGVMDADRDEELPEDEDASNATSEIHDVAQEFTSKINLQNSVDASDIRTVEFDVADVYEQTSESDEGSVSTSSHENTNGLSSHEPKDFPENGNGVTSNDEELKDEPEPDSNKSKLVEEQSEPKDTVIGLKMETNKENLQKHDQDDYHQRIEAIKKGREREKDRIVVERAIREARERAFAEARERAERAAVEKAAAEARKRAMAEAREKVDKANKEAKLRAERAAVERATTEARGRALEKAMSQKTTDAEGRTPEKVSEPSRNNGLKHSFSSSDLENVTESAQRRKARLERHQRIMERAAKALAEKNMRDVLAQKEQAERNRLSESLDADIKRWSTGKEKNMRALLSTLQYILGPDSGWQPIPLTEIVTTAAVKKAYRKATLYVHPDKLQQRGASIRQKYICEKVFDLLKAAWSRFNSDER